MGCCCAVIEKGAAGAAPSPSSKLDGSDAKAAAGILLRHELIQAHGIEANHDFVADHQRRSGTAAIGVDQLVHCLRIHRNVAVFKVDTPRREVGLGSPARRSTRLGEDDDLLGHAA